MSPKETVRSRKSLFQVNIPVDEMDELRVDAESSLLPMSSVVRRALKTQRSLARFAAAGWTLLPPSGNPENAVPIESVNPGDIALGSLSDRYKRQIDSNKSLNTPQ